MKQCSVDGCQRPHSAKGYCAMHYRRAHTTGRVDKVVQTMEERFWSKVNKTETCWLWTASVNHSGYGHFGIDGRMRLAHRVSFAMANGSIPDGVELDHRCLTPACVRPDHLRLATSKQQKENIRGAQRNSKSGVRGVCWEPRVSRWRAVVKHNYRQVHVGTFKTIEEAERAVIAKRLELFTHNEVDRVTA